MVETKDPDGTPAGNEGGPAAPANDQPVAPGIVAAAEGAGGEGPPGVKAAEPQPDLGRALDRTEPPWAETPRSV